MNITKKFSALFVMGFIFIAAVAIISIFHFTKILAADTGPAEPAAPDTFMYKCFDGYLWKQKQAIFSGLSDAEFTDQYIASHWQKVAPCSDADCLASQGKCKTTSTATSDQTATAGTTKCDYNSSDTKTCCKCDSPTTMCLSKSGFYRICSNGCYSNEKQCTAAICTGVCPAGSTGCNSDDLVNRNTNPLQPCPDANLSDFKCTSAGSIQATSMQDGATYLDICDKSFTAIHAQCTLNTTQKEGVACYEAMQNNLDFARNNIKPEDNFTIDTDTAPVQPIGDVGQSSNDDQLYVSDSLEGKRYCKDLIRDTKENFEDQIRTGISDLATVRLACCLTTDHCQAKGCDEKIVYDVQKGCGLENGPDNPFAKANQINLNGVCDVCTKGTFGCGSGISSAGNYKSCDRTTNDTNNPNANCWSPNKVCNAWTSDEQDAAQNYCGTMKCNGAPGPQMWTKDGIAAALAKKTTTTTKSCSPAAMCSTQDGNIYLADPAKNCAMNESKTNTAFFISCPNGCDPSTAKCKSAATSSTGCPKTKCNSNAAAGEVITVWDGTSKPTDKNGCVYHKSTDAAQVGCKKCVTDMITKEAACSTTAPVSACPSGTKECLDAKGQSQGCYNSGALQTCNAGVVGCDCKVGLTQSCNQFPNNKEVCTADGQHYYVAQLSSNNAQGYCVYPIQTDKELSVDCGSCKQLQTAGSDGKFVQCTSTSPAGCVPASQFCTVGGPKCCTGTCTNGTCPNSAANCVAPKISQPTHTWQNNNSSVRLGETVTNNVPATCMAGSGSDYDSLTIPLTLASGNQYQANIPLSTLQSTMGIQGSDDQGNNGGDNSNNNNNSGSGYGSSGNIDAKLTVICRNTDPNCQGSGKNLDSAPATADCGQVPGSPTNPGGGSDNNNNNNQQTALTVSSCTAQASGTGTSATVNISASTNGPATCTYNANGSGSKTMQAGSNQEQFTDNSILASSLQSGNNTFNITCKASGDNNSGNGNSNSNSNSNNSNGNNSGSTQTYTGSATCTAQFTNTSANAPQITACSSTLGTGTTSTTLQLKATASANATCAYGVNTDKGTVAAGQQMQSTDKLNFTDNVLLSALQPGNNIFYIRCKSSETSGAENNNPCQVQYNNTSISITNPLPTGVVTSSPVTLSVTTAVAATCRFSTTDQDYNSMPSANQFIQTQQGNNTYAQQYQLAVDNNKNYQYFVRCRDSNGNTNPVSAQITFNTSLTGAGMLTITNPQPTGTVTGSSVIISVQTSINAACSYTKDGATHLFDNTNSVYHSSTVPITVAGPQTYPVSCVNSANQNDKQTATIAFSANLSGPGDCAQVDAADKLPDSKLGNASSYNSTYDYTGSNTTNYNSDLSQNAQYMWQSSESGSLGQFSNVNWNAGYQFSPSADGWITELCGFFDSSDSNSKVSLYECDGLNNQSNSAVTCSSTKNLATATVQSNNNWNCQTISPVQVASGQNYFVIAKIDNGPIYYKNQNNLFPKNNNGYTIVQGVRELDDEPFGTKITSYKYMTFGMVDARFATDLGSVGYGNDQSAPKMSDPQPSVNINTGSPILHIVTAGNAFCKFDRWDRSYENMHYVFSNNGGTTHEQKVCDLQNGVYTYYVRCSANGKANTQSLRISFNVQSTTGNGGEPSITNAKPSGTINTNSTVVSVNTPAGINAQCKFDTNDVSYNSMANGMNAQTDPASSSLIQNFANIGNLNDGNYTYYVRCRDANGNTNTTSTVISFRVQNSGTSDATPPQISNASVSSTSVSSGSLVKITASVTDNQAVSSVTAKIRNAAGQVVASLALLDDGVNDDGVAANHIYGNSWNTSGIGSGTYNIDLSATDTFGNASSQTNVKTVTVN